MKSVGSSAGCTVWQQQEGTWGVSVYHCRSCPVLWQWPAGGGTPAPAALTAYPSSFSLPPPSLGQEGIPGWSWLLSWKVYPVSSDLLLRCCCSSRLLHRKWPMPPQSHRQKSRPAALQRTWASSADGVCADLSYLLLQCDQSSPVYCSGERPGTTRHTPHEEEGTARQMPVRWEGEIEAAVVIGLRSNAGPCLAKFSLTCKEVKVHIWLNANSVSDMTEHYLNIQQELLLNLTQVVLEPKPNHTMSLWRPKGHNIRHNMQTVCKNLTFLNLQ